jgi:hypothetical protein
MAWIARLIVLALVAALADAAYATGHGPTISLAAVGTGAVLALVALVLFWARPWIAVAFGALMLACAFAAGTLAGVGSGPSFTGVAATDAAALVFAAAILIAAIATCVALRNIIVRVLVLIVAAYPLVTTLASVQHGGLAAAFGSAPLAWTRGPYVAAEILLPLFAAGAVIYALIQLFRKRGAQAATAFVLAVAFAAATQLGALAAGAAGLPTIVAFEGTSAFGSATAPIGAGAKPSNATGASDAIAPETGPLFTPKGSGDVPAEVAAAAATIPKDPQHALEAVAGLADDLYSGALGGSVEALRSGSANSVDKALLLRDLVRAGSPTIETAFARCTLSVSDSDALIAQARAGRTPHPKIVMQAADAAASTTGNSAARATLQRWAKAWKALVAQTQDEGKKLAGQLQTAGLTLPTGQPAPDRLRALAAQHVWVRARVNGNWTDLDPTIEPSVPGKTRCASQSQTPALPDDLYDVLGVRIAVEVQAGGGAHRTIVLDRTMRTADLGDRDVSFMFAEPVGVVSGSAPATPPPAGMLTFTPLLRVGDENVAGTPIVLPVPPLTTNAVAKSVNAATGALDRMGASPSPTAAAAPATGLPVVTGVWMELSVTAPGSAATTVQSPIFDRIGYVARAAHAAPPTLGAQPDGASYRAMQTMWNIAVSAGHTASAGGPASIARGIDVPAVSGALARLHGAYYAVRRALIDDVRSANVGVAAARPGISLLALTNGGLTMDVASDDALPLASDEARPAWAAASVLAERQLVNGDTLLTTGNPAAIPGTDALTAFDRATLDGTRIVALRPSDGAPPQSAAVPAEARARMSAHLAQGASLLALAPATAQSGAPPYAYWIVDPATGTLRDENAIGRHQEAAEETVVQEEVAIKNISTWRKFTCKILPVIRVVAFTLSVAHGSLPFSPAGAGGLAGVNKAATDEAVRQAQEGLDQPVACGGP